MKKYVSILVFALMMSACTSATVTVKEGIVVEYGLEVKLEDLVAQEGITLKEVKAFDAKKVGEQTVTAVFDQAGKEITQEIKLEVKDTKNPEITLNKEEVEITAGDEYDSKSNIKAVKDPVDGDIKYSDVKDLKKDGYQITGELKKDTAGTYEQKVIAYDVNGNKSEKSFKVIVKEKEETNDDQQTTTNGQADTSSTTVNANAGSTGGGTAQATGGTNTGSGQATDGGATPAPQPTPVPEPTPAPQPTPEPKPTVLCPNGIFPQYPCNEIINGMDGNPGNSGMWFDTMEEADAWADSVTSIGGTWEGHGWSSMDVEYNDGSKKWSVHFY